MTEPIDNKKPFQDWIGREHIARERIDPEMVHRFTATLGIALPPGDGVPFGLHWCLAPQFAERSQIGGDGHPQRGLYLPPVELPRRMWASSALTFHDDLRVGDMVERRSHIVSIVEKTGSSGQLCFITVLHQSSTSRGLAVEESQTIVYRDHPRGDATPPSSPPVILQDGAAILDVSTDPVLLFRFSALTFNSHRIHYDAPYAMNVEGYPGLVVHGPLQAAFLMHCAAEKLGPLRQFSFRGTSPLICGRSFRIVVKTGDEHLSLSVVDDVGDSVMTPSVSSGWVTPLFVPATRPDRFSKAATAGGDAIIIDLEDAVAPEDKDAARDRLVAATLPDIAVIVRINATGTSWHTNDVAALAGLPVAAVMLAKAEHGEHLAQVRAALGSGVGLIPLIETASGLANARALAGGAGVVQLAFGSIDYCADIGASHSQMALLSARSELVLASRLAGRNAPLDGVTSRIDDPTLVEEDARHAREVGFGGKLCIHPAQIEPARRGLAPNNAELAWAQTVLATDEDGATTINGDMIDAPVRARAGEL